MATAAPKTPSPEIRSQIVASATKFFSRFGFHKTTMEEIARNIHKAKGLIYYYFRSKEELFNEVLRAELQAVKDELLVIVRSPDDAIHKITEYIRTRYELLNRAVNYHETLKADFFEKYHFVKDVRDDFDAFEQEQLTRIIREGSEDGYLQLRSIEPTVNVAMMIIKSIDIPLFLQDKYAEYEQTIVELLTMITRSFQNQRKE
ncbi:MAG: TetR family transcriptional regulator [Bacteroidales bacterium]